MNISVDRLQLLNKPNNEINGVTSTALGNAKAYFVACMNTTASDKQSTRSMKEVGTTVFTTLVNTVLLM